MNGSMASAAAGAAASAPAAAAGRLAPEESHRATESTSQRPVLPHAYPHSHSHQRRPRSILRHRPSSSLSGSSASSSSSSTSASASAHRRPPKTLSFHPRIAGRTIDSLSDLGPAMVRTLWYTDADQAALAGEVAASIRHMRRRHQGQQSQQQRSGGGGDARPDNHNDNNDDDDDEAEDEDDDETFCTRGLEHMLNGRTLAEQSRAQNAALAAVLDEQRLQRLRASRAGAGGRRAACNGGGGAQQQQVVCPTTLAVVAAAASRRHAEVARTRAAEDAAAVRRYLRREVGRDVVQRALEIEGRASSAIGAPAASPEATAVPCSSSSSSSSSAASSIQNQHQHQSQASGAAPAAAAARATAATSSYLNTKRRLSARSLAGPAPVTTMMTLHPSSSVLGGTLSLREESRRSSFLQQFAANGASAGAVAVGSGAPTGAGAAGTTLPRTTAPPPTTNTAGTFAGMPTFQSGSGLSMTTSQLGIMGRGQPMMKRRRSDGFLSASATSLLPSPPNEATSTEEVLPAAGPTAVADGSSSESTPTPTPLGDGGSTVTPTTTSFSDLHIGGGYLSS